MGLASGPPSQGANADGLVHFDELQAISGRVEMLRNRQVTFMRGFYNPKLKCFQHNPAANERPSISSTCLAVMTILKDPKMWTGVAGRASTAEICLPDMRDSLMEAEWSMDPVQTSQLLIAMTRLKQPADSPKMQAAITNLMISTASASGIDTKKKMPVSVKKLKEWASGGDGQGKGGKVASARTEQSMYLTYWCTQALFEALQGFDAEGRPYVPSDQLAEMSMLLERVSALAYDELCRQLAFNYAGDNAKFELVQLAYALLVHFETSGDLTKEGKMNLGSNDDRMPPLNMKLAEKALDVIFSSQMENGLWPQGTPIDPVGDKVRGDVGNSFVFSFDMLGSLLATISRGHVELFRQYIPQIHTSLKWAEDNVVESVLSGYCDVDTRVSSGTFLRGWRSNHLKDGGGPIMWCTAQVFLALTQMRVLLSELTNNDILMEFGGVHGIEPDATAWRQLLDADLELQGEPASLKQSLDDNLMTPIVNMESRDPLDSMTGLGLSGSSSSVKYSLILYGPPGTAKTTICTSMAKKLGWSFMTIDTADFLAEGLAHVASRMTYIFDKLKALQRCVILFDEVEEFCLDREDKTLTMESRMLTTAMLTQLNDLRRQQKCVFIVATNRLRSFDAAVTRPGRFDLIYLVGTPALKERHARFVKRLENEGIHNITQPVFDASTQKVTQELASDVVYEYLLEDWDNHVRFLNFAENEAFMESVMALVRSKQLSREAFQALLQRTMVTATIQGAVKEEYVQSMQLSR